MQRTEKFSILQLEKEYNLEKLTTKHMELIEIASKYGFYKKRCVCRNLRPAYEIVHLLSLFIAEKEINFAKRT